MKTLTKQHVFEKSDLGIAPFRLLRVDMVEQDPDGPRRGTSCDYCGTYITNLFFCESSDGKKFVIGSTCVEKLGDAGLTDAAKSEVTNHRRELREAKWRAQMEPIWEKERNEARMAAQKRLTEFDRVKPILAKQPHPNDYFASQGKTKLDYLLYFIGGLVDDPDDLSEKIRLDSRVNRILREAGADI